MISVVNPNKRGKYKNSKTGRFFMKNPQKFLGNEIPIYKSQLEWLCMRYLDENPSVVQWGYETCFIKYLDKSSNPPKVRRYFIDFVAKVKVGQLVKTVWIEIKSKKETTKPKANAKLEDQLIWLKNQCKWEAAIALAKSKGYDFKVITEEQLT